MDSKHKDRLYSFVGFEVCVVGVGRAWYGSLLLLLFSVLSLAFCDGDYSMYVQKTVVCVQGGTFRSTELIRNDRLIYGPKRGKDE
jgi:hypothetical protein